MRLSTRAREEAAREGLELKIGDGRAPKKTAADSRKIKLRALRR